ncbi:MAG: hypothetical protein AAFZ01_10850 [Pseudomonadota bacterium]
MLQTPQSILRPKPATPRPRATEDRLASYKTGKPQKPEVQIGKKLSKILDTERVRRVRSIRDRMSGNGDAFGKATSTAMPMTSSSPDATTQTCAKIGGSTAIEEPLDQIIYVWDVFRRRTRST